MKIWRVRLILAAYDRGEFDFAGLMSRLDTLTELASRDARPSRKPTYLGPCPILWTEP